MTIEEIRQQVDQAIKQSLIRPSCGETNNAGYNYTALALIAALLARCGNNTLNKFCARQRTDFISTPADTESNGINAQRLLDATRTTARERQLLDAVEEQLLTPIINEHARSGGPALTERVKDAIVAIVLVRIRWDVERGNEQFASIVPLLTSQVPYPAPQHSSERYLGDDQSSFRRSNDAERQVLIGLGLSPEEAAAELAASDQFEQHLRDLGFDPDSDEDVDSYWEQRWTQNPKLREIRKRSLDDVVAAGLARKATPEEQRQIDFELGAQTPQPCTQLIRNDQESAGGSWSKADPTCRSCNVGRFTIQVDKLDGSGANQICYICCRRYDGGELSPSDAAEALSQVDSRKRRSQEVHQAEQEEARRAHEEALQKQALRDQQQEIEHYELRRAQDGPPSRQVGFLLVSSIVAVIVALAGWNIVAAESIPVSPLILVGLLLGIGVPIAVFNAWASLLHDFRMERSRKSRH